MSDARIFSNKARDLKIIEKIYLIRRMDEKLMELYPSDVIKSPVHLSIGQESIPAVVCHYLNKEDAVFGSYRSHALYLAKGGDPNAFMAEMYGKETGCCKGKGGSMHICDPENGVMGTSAIVSSTIPTAVGWAYANKLKGNKNIAVSFFGDGATDEGVYYESINFAVVKKVPILFICENNGLAIHSRIKARNSNPNITGKINGFNIYIAQTTSTNLDDMCGTISQAIDYIREHQVPVLIEIKTFRWMEHVGIKEDWNLGYRKEEEADYWYAKDPLENYFRSSDLKEKREMISKVDKIVNDAVFFAENSAFPEVEELYKDLY